MAESSHWWAVAASSEVRRQPLARTVLHTPLVVFRDAKGLGVLRDRCPHRGAPLSAGRVTEAGLQCPYHGWTFGPDGTCVRVPGRLRPGGPRTGHLAFRAVEQQGLVWVAGALAGAHPPRLRQVGAVATTSTTLHAAARAGWGHAIENLLDGTHAPYVHGRWLQPTPRPTPIEVHRGDGYVEATYHARQEGFIPRWLGASVTHGTARYDHPGRARLDYRDGAHIRFAVEACFTPIDAQRTQVLVVASTPQRRFLPSRLIWALLRPMLRRVLAQDRAILEQQADNLARHPDAAFRSTEADVLGPYIHALMAGHDIQGPDRRRVIEV
ncbi:MAG: aromatic ring-hydroxylating dioxygenase subunit alpha [Myxococcota bacterium]